MATAAPAAVIGQLNSPAYINWVKAARALHCTVEVLRLVCDVKMNTFHQSLVGLHGSTRCSGPCTSGNIVFDPVRHHWSVVCPSNVCSQWLTSIVSGRAWPQVRLTFANSNIEDWPVEAWQIAKVYMAQGQDTAATSSSDTDASGLLQLITNCGQFGSSLRKKADKVSRCLFLQYDIVTCL